MELSKIHVEAGELVFKARDLVGQIKELEVELAKVNGRINELAKIKAETKET